jgi:hypothetical protein
VFEVISRSPTGHRQGTDGRSGRACPTATRTQRGRRRRSRPRPRRDSSVLFFFCFFRGLGRMQAGLRGPWQCNPLHVLTFSRRTRRAPRAIKTVVLRGTQSRAAMVPDGQSRAHLPSSKQHRTSLLALPNCAHTGPPVTTPCGHATAGEFLMIRRLVVPRCGQRPSLPCTPR